MEVRGGGEGRRRGEEERGGGEMRGAKYQITGWFSYMYSRF